MLEELQSGFLLWCTIVIIVRLPYCYYACASSQKLCKRYKEKRLVKQEETTTKTAVGSLHAKRGKEWNPMRWPRASSQCSSGVESSFCGHIYNSFVWSGDLMVLQIPFHPLHHGNFMWIDFARSLRLVKTSASRRWQAADSSTVWDADMWKSCVLRWTLL